MANVMAPGNSAVIQMAYVAAVRDTWRWASRQSPARATSRAPVETATWASEYGEPRACSADTIAGYSGKNGHTDHTPGNGGGPYPWAAMCLYQPLSMRMRRVMSGSG